MFISGLVLTTLLLINIQISYQQICPVMSNVDYFGYDIGGARIAATSDQCCQLCNNDPTCVAFTWVCNQQQPSCSLCYLKSCVDQRTVRTANLRFSGVKRQVATTTRFCQYINFC